MSDASPDAAPAPLPAELCHHCQQNKITRPRHLCRRCHKDPKIRKQYKPVSAHGHRMPVIPFGPRPLAKTACPHAPLVTVPGAGHEDKVKVVANPQKIEQLQERAARGDSLFRPDDAPMDPEIDRVRALRVERKPTRQAQAAPQRPAPRIPAKKKPVRVCVTRRAHRRFLYLWWQDADRKKACWRSTGTDDPQVARQKAEALARALGGQVTAGQRWRRPRPGWVSLRRAGDRYRLVVTTGERPQGRSLVHAIQSDDARWLATLLAHRLAHAWRKRGTLSLSGQDVEKIRMIGVWNRGERGRRVEELEDVWFAPPACLSASCHPVEDPG